MNSDEVDRFFVDNGTVDELQLDEGIQQHLYERGIYSKHEVTLSELLEVHEGQPRYFLNRAGKHAPVIMVGPTSSGRMLCIPIEPAKRKGVWCPVTAFEANAHDIRRYYGGEG